VLGFHCGAFPGSQGEGSSSEVERDIYGTAGFGKAFIDRALATANSDMWKPDAAELMSSHVVTKLSDGREFAMGGNPLTRAEWDKSMQQSAPVYDALKRKYPVDYDQILDIFASGSARGTPPAELTAKAQQKLRATIMTLLPLADDGVLVEFARLRADEYRTLQAQDAAACTKFVAGASLDEGVIRKLPADLTKRELVLHEQIVLSAGQRDKSDSTEESVKASWVGIKANLAKKGFGTADLQALAQPGEASSPARYCATAVELFAEIVRLPTREAALVFRDMYGGDK
jgi:hypothetical protein